MKITKQIFVCFSFLVVISIVFSCKTIEKAAKKSPREEFNDKLTQLSQKGDLEGILKLIDESDPELTKDFKIQYLKLSILISMRKTKEAESFADELSKAYPNNTDILYAQVMLAQAENNLQKKDKYLKKILVINPKDS